MRRVQADDHEAFAAVIRRYQNPLLNFFRRMGVYTDAEDLVQETFLRLYRYRARYRPSAQLRTFLYRMAGQIFVDHVRKVRRRRKLAQELRERARDASSEGGARPQDDSPVREALARLPEPLRQTVVLRVYQELKYAEIAEVMAIPVGTVKSRMFMALRMLREVMDGTDE